VSKSVTLAHLSDVHLPFHGGFTSGLRPGLVNVKRVLGWLNWTRKRQFIHLAWAIEKIVADVKARAPDHVLVSGDLINIGLPSEYEAAREWLTALGPPGWVSVVPGNHDAYVAREAEAGLALWSPYMASDAFGQTIAEPGMAFPYVRRAGPVAIIGVNSGVATRPGSAIGEIGAQQLARLATSLDRLGEAGLVRLVMIHHPPVPGLAPPQRALSDAEALAGVLAQHGAELVVHGHNHVMSSIMNGAMAIEGVASASAGRAYSDEPLARYNLIRIAPPVSPTGSVQIEIETRGLDSTGEAVTQIALRTIDIQVHRTQFKGKGSAL